MNKFEQVSSVGHETSLAGGWDQGVPGLMPRGVAGGRQGLGWSQV